MKIVWDRSVSKINFLIEDNAGVYNTDSVNYVIHIEVMVKILQNPSDIENQWISVGGSWGFLGGRARYTLWSGETPFYNGYLSGSFDFTGFRFDSTLEIYLCSDRGGISKLGACEFQNVRIAYKYVNTFLDLGYFGSSTNSYSTMFYSILATLIGNYQFTEATGYSTVSSAGTLGTAYFGASTSSTPDTTYSPSWLTTVIL